MSKSIVGGALLAVSFAIALGAARPAADPQYKFLKEIPIGGGSGWDYLQAEPEGHRLYVTHKTKVVVIDTATDKIVGTISDTPGVHGFVPIPALKKGYSSNGQENKVSVVDLDSLKTLSKIPTGANPDAILYEPASGEFYVFNGRGKSATVIDTKTDKVLVEAIDLGGKPETGVADSAAGKVYVNIEDKNEIAVIDIKTHKVEARWPIAPGEGASGLAFDPELHRLIIACSNSKMAMMDSTNGKIVSVLDCGQGVDASAFDPAPTSASSRLAAAAPSPSPRSPPTR